MAFGVNLMRSPVLYRAAQVMPQDRRHKRAHTPSSILQALTQLDIFKAKEAIVHAIVSKLGPNVPNGHARQGLVGGQISDGGDEGVHAIVFALCKEASHQDDVCGCLSQTCNIPVGNTGNLTRDEISCETQWPGQLLQMNDLQQRAEPGQALMWLTLYPPGLETKQLQSMNVHHATSGV